LDHFSIGAYIQTEMITASLEMSPRPFWHSTVEICRCVCVNSVWPFSLDQPVQPVCVYVIIRGSFDK